MFHDPKHTAEATQGDLTFIHEVFNSQRSINKTNDQTGLIHTEQSKQTFIKSFIDMVISVTNIPVPVENCGSNI